jgi:hydroxymethylbilane synthase
VLTLDGLVAKPDGSAILRGSLSGPPNDAETLGFQLADDLIARGARELL